MYGWDIEYYLNYTVSAIIASKFENDHYRSLYSMQIIHCKEVNYKLK